MAALMTITEYQDRLGRSLTGAKERQAEVYLDDASAIVRRIAVPHLDDADDTSVPAEIKPIIFGMVRRGIDNPRGLTAEQIGDYRWTAPPGQAIYTTPDEDRLILGAVGEGTVGTITLEGVLPERLLDQATVGGFVLPVYSED